MSSRYLRASGSWGGPVWASTPTGNAGSASTPTASDSVFIQANYTVTLNSNASCDRIVHTSGTLSLGSYRLDVTASSFSPAFSSSGSTNRTINLGSGVLSVTDFGFGGMELVGSNLNFNAGTSTVELNIGDFGFLANAKFYTLSKTFNDVKINLKSTPANDSEPISLAMTGSPTFNTLHIRNVNDVQHTVNLDNGATLRVNKLILIGYSSGSQLRLENVTDTLVTSIEAASPWATSYGYEVFMWDVHGTGWGSLGYIGEGSTLLDSTGWTQQNPPAANTLLDKFDTGTTPGSLWDTTLSGTGYANVAGGQLTMGWTSGSSSYSSITTSNTYDFVDRETYIKVSSMFGDGMGISLDGTGLYAGISNTSSETFYRIKGVQSGANTTITIARQNGSSWTNLSSVTVDSNLARSNRITIGGGRNSLSDTLVLDSVGEAPGLSLDGTLLFGGGVSRRLLARRLVSGTLLFGGGAFNQGTHSREIDGTLIYGGGANGRKVSIRSISGLLSYGGGLSPQFYSIREISGTLKFGGGVAYPLVTRYNEISGTLMFSGGARNTLIRDAEALQDKRYLYKVYDPDGNYIEVWKDVVSELNFTHEINTIGSSTTIELARNSDTVGVGVEALTTEGDVDLLTEDNLQILASVESKNQIGSGSSVDYNNRVDITVFYGSVEPLYTEGMETLTTEDDEDLLADIGAPNGRRIFTGFISEINSRYGSTETTIVQLTSYGWDLDQYPITTSGGATTVPFLSKDPSQIAKDAVDKFVSDSSSEGSYTHRDSLSIQDTGTVVSYTFKSNTYKDVLDKTLELMPSNWYYFVGLGDNLVYYRQQSATPHHLFYLGKHIKALDLKGSIVNSTNRVLFTGGGDPALYIDRTEAPAGRTRRTLEMMSDNRVTLLASANILAEGAIEAGNKLHYRTTVEILTKQYDIESIEVGDTIGFRNFGNEVDGLLMQVIGLSYSPDSVQLQLDSKPPTISKRLADLKRNLIVSENQNLPTTPS